MKLKRRATASAEEFYEEEGFDSILEGPVTPELRDLFRKQYEEAKAIAEEHMRLLKEILLEEVPGLSVYHSDTTFDDIGGHRW
jgi:hypothetical protein